MGKIIKHTPETLEAQLTKAVEQAIKKTAKAPTSPQDVIDKIGVPSPEHTNFRYHLAPEIAQIIECLRN